jgi:succinate dehydrogenase / fumarate reductase cytochrome b subunit
MAETHLKAAASRPLSPHLSIFRPLITMVMSIVHRITGAALYFGMLLLAWWLMAMSMPKAYELVEPVVASWFGRLVLLGFTWAFIHHLLGGLRHLFWDTGHGYSEAMRNGLAWATIVGSVVLTLIVWIVGYSIR